MRPGSLGRYYAPTSQGIKFVTSREHGGLARGGVQHYAPDEGPLPKGFGPQAVPVATEETASMKTPVCKSVLRAFGLLLLGFCTGLPGAERPSVTAGRLGPPPVIDGDLSDACWAACPALELTMLGTGQPPTQRTRVQIGYDPRALYVAFRCFEDRPGEMVGAVTDRDGEVFRDDCVEVFLAPHADRTRYYHFLVNVAGTQRDDLGADPAWNATWESAVARWEGGWSAEMAIPFDQLGLLPDTPADWRLNAAREEHPHGELSCWAPCQAGFHEPDRFGVLDGILADLGPAIGATLAASRARIAGRVEAAGDQPAAARGRELLAGADKALEQGGLQEAADLLRQAEAAAERAEFQQRQHRLRAASGDPEARFVVCAENSLVKVRGDRPYEGAPARALSLSLARREYEALQVVVVCTVDEGLKGCRVTVSPLGTDDGARIEPPDVTVNVVGFVTTQKASGGAWLTPGRLPDPLLPDQAVDIPPMQPQPFWVTVYARPELRPGVYRGTVTVAAEGCPPKTLPFSVRVFDFELPVRPALRTCFLLDPGAVVTHYGLPGPWAWTSNETGYVSDPRALSVTDGLAAAGRRALTGPANPSRYVHFRAPVGGSPRRVVAFDYRYDGPGGLFLLFGGGAAGGKNAFFTPPDQSPGAWCHAVCRLADAGVVSACTIEFVHDNRGTGQPHTFFLDNVRITETAEGGERDILNEDFERGLPADQGADLIRNFRCDMLAHRISDGNVAAPRVAVDDAAGVSLDWTDFDREIAFYRERGLTGFNLNWLRIGSGWGAATAAGDERARQTAAELCRRTEAHLAEKGWLDDGYIYTFDEPGPEAMRTIRQVFEFVHQHAPRLRTLLTFGYGATRPWTPAAPEGPEAAYAMLEGAVDIWVPHIDCADLRVLERQRGRPRTELWHYVCISAQKPYPNLWGIDYRGVDHRMVYWQLWRYRLTGTLYWAVTYWKENVWENPMSYPGGNGDGSLYYWVDGVHAAAGSDGKPDSPVRSIRLALTRDGIEDYDYMALLREAAARASGPAAAEAERLLDVSDLTPAFDRYSAAPEALLGRREQIAQMLERLQRQR